MKKLCETKGFYNAAVGKLSGTKAKLLELKKIKLVKYIKRTLRRVLARILGCPFVRKGPLSKIVRRSVEKITTKKVHSNVFHFAKMLKKISKNYT